MSNNNQNRSKAIDRVNASLKRRYARERRFRRIGLGAVIMGLLFVSLLFVNIIGNGYTAFQQTYIQLNVEFSETLDPDGNRDPAVLSTANSSALSADRASPPEVCTK